MPSLRYRTRSYWHRCCLWSWLRCFVFAFKATMMGFKSRTNRCGYGSPFATKTLFSGLVFYGERFSFEFSPSFAFHYFCEILFSLFNRMGLLLFNILLI